MKIIPRKTNLRLLVNHPFVFVKFYRLPLVVLLIGALLDTITTSIFVSKYGAECEVHLVQRMVFDIFGPAVGVPLAKIIQLLFVIFVASWWRPWCGWIIVVCGLFYTIAAISNHFSLL